MKISIRTLFAIVASATLGVSEVSYATSTGINTDPGGTWWDRGDADTATANWDTYTSFQFTNDAPDASSTISVPFLSQSTAITTGAQAQGAGLWDSLGMMSGAAGDDIIHPGPLQLNFSVTGTTSFEIGDFHLQIKRATSNATLQTSVAPTLNGLPADSSSFTSGTGDTTSDSGNWSVTTWRWTNSLIGQNLTNINLSIGFASTHRAIDGIVIDAAAIPEPAGLALLGSGTLLALRRRRV